MQINQLPQEIKYQLIFDESIDGPKLAKDVFQIDYAEFRNNLIKKCNQNPTAEPEEKLDVQPSHENENSDLDEENNEETTNDDTGTGIKTSFDNTEKSMENEMQQQDIDVSPCKNQEQPERLNQNSDEIKIGL